MTSTRPVLKPLVHIIIIFSPLSFFCCLLFPRTVLIRSLEGGAVGLKGKVDNLYAAMVMLLIVNLFMDFLTFYAVMRDVVWLLNLFILVEGVSITFFLFRTFSPLVVLRLVVLLLGAQVRARIIMVRATPWCRRWLTLHPATEL